MAAAVLSPSADRSPRPQSILRHNSTFASSSTAPSTPSGFDVVKAYKKALTDEKVPPPIAAILALVQLMESSTASTVTGLASELTVGRQILVDTQISLGVRAGCQLWERFFALSGGGEILTHAYSRTVIQAILRAHKQHKRVKVYVTGQSTVQPVQWNATDPFYLSESRPSGLGLRTHQVLTAAGIPCTVVLDSAVAYIMERVDMVLVGSEVVVESGGLVSAVGTYQIGLIAKATQKPFYALAESYKFLRHYPLSQTDLPLPKLIHPSSSLPPLSFPASLPYAPPPQLGQAEISTPTSSQRGTGRGMTREMEDINPLVDVTTPDLIDFIITDLGAPLSPTSVSQYLVAQFSS
ncbi:translation initiation factor eIF-2B subunit alpha, partial [Tremellales sp. Uapishka_1]